MSVPVASAVATAQPRIVGGEPADVADRPWMVALVAAEGYQFCGGTLIAPDRVATAAHCLDEHAADDIIVVGGRSDLSRPRDGESITSVTEAAVHETYQRAEMGGDVAVLTLASEFPYETLPVATASDLAVYRPGKVGTVLGWGRLTAAWTHARVTPAGRSWSTACWSGSCRGARGVVTTPATTPGWPPTPGS